MGLNQMIDESLKVEVSPRSRIMDQLKQQTLGDFDIGLLLSIELDDVFDPKNEEHCEILGDVKRKALRRVMRLIEQAADEMEDAINEL